MTHAYSMFQTNLKSKFPMVSIRYKHRSIYLSVSDISSVSYNQEGPDTRIEAFRKESVLIQNNDFVTVFLDDLHQILMDQTELMESFQVHYEIPSGVNEENYYKDYLEHIGFRIFRQILSTLPQRTGKLKTQEFSFFTHISEYLPQILSFLDLNSLEQIPMENLKNFNFAEFEKVLDLEIWRNEENPKNQLRLVFGFNEISERVMETIEKAFSNCSYFESIVIKAKIIDQLSLTKTFGPPKPETDQFEEGHRMEISNSNGDLLIYSFEDGFHYFSRFQKDLESEISSLEGDLEELSICENLECLNLIRNLPEHLKSLCLVPSDSNIPREIFENHIILERVLKNQQLFEIFQKSEIESLRLDFSNLNFFPSPMVFEIDDSETPIDYDLVEKSNLEFLDKFQNVLKKLRPLKIRELSLRCVQEGDLRTVLEFLEPGFLKKIDIEYFCDFRNEKVSRNGILTVPYPDRRSYPRTLELRNVSKMEQWMLAENLEIEKYRILTPIQNFNIAHFKKGKITVESMSSEDVVFLKNIFLANPSLEKFIVQINQCQIDVSLYHPDFLGNPVIASLKAQAWYFQYPESENYLHIKYNVFQSITFSKVHSSVVPAPNQ
ncbi:hypothetical protein L3Y34_009839 [Caenorhabditis briggsae]|uniref:DUF38 domain-containing protein n=1 Tax=Caenorhabditis briggsae TaxID=6238 RepID=A0AAE9D3G2_CAEBR|nr:hypothetical protein L3Y34_009839 [Caenorhabditis briggsae]